MGIDLAKQSFQLHGEDKRGHTVLQKKSSRGKSVAYVANLPPCLIGVKARASSNHWYRVFTEMGHTVCLIAPQLVKPFVKSNNKNDAIDVEAICEAVQRPRMRFVSPKSIEYVSASRQDPNGVFLARAPVFSEYIFPKLLKGGPSPDRVGNLP
uniref:Transposase n=1 Tax=Candidatus Kentrum sp. TC TaxID=2126339 RepID=A0A450YBK5_9GAMM|nr:MAG: Transposase [Candidatus Kentron sp. TC]